MGAGHPLPAACNELIHQLSHQGVHVLVGALGFQGQVDLLQAGFLWDRQAGVREVSVGRTLNPQVLSPQPSPWTKEERTVRAKKAEGGPHKPAAVVARERSRLPLTKRPNSQTGGSRFSAAPSSQASQVSDLGASSSSHLAPSLLSKPYHPSRLGSHSPSFGSAQTAWPSRPSLSKLLLAPPLQLVSSRERSSPRPQA